MYRKAIMVKGRGIGNYPQPSLWQEDHLLNAQQTSAAAAAPSLSLSLYIIKGIIYMKKKGGKA